MTKPKSGGGNLPDCYGLRVELRLTRKAKAYIKKLKQQDKRK